MKKIPKESVVKGVRMTRQVADMLADLARLEEMPEQAVIRQLIKRSHASRIKK